MQWCTEEQTSALKMSAKVKETLFTGKSDFQEVAVVDSEQFGRMLVLDGVFQTSIADEFVYHEMIAHIPLYIHPNPKKVLIIGGGDGGTAREVLRHTTVEKAEMVEIDGMVVDVSKKYLPEISVVLNDSPKNFELKIGDGIQHMADAEDEYDVIIVDCSDPIGPGEGLFTHDFYKNVFKALKTDGLFVQQTESPFYHQELIKKIHKDVNSIFPITEMYLAHIPLYPGGMHSFTIGSKKYSAADADVAKRQQMKMRYHNAEVQKAAFALPNFVQELIK